MNAKVSLLPFPENSTPGTMLHYLGQQEPAAAIVITVGKGGAINYCSLTEDGTGFQLHRFLGTLDIVRLQCWDDMNEDLQNNSAPSG